MMLQVLGILACLALGVGIAVVIDILYHNIRP